MKDQVWFLVISSVILRGKSMQKLIIMKTKSCPKLTVICHLGFLSCDVFWCFGGALHAHQVSGACEDMTSHTDWVDHHQAIINCPLSWQMWLNCTANALSYKIKSMEKVSESFQNYFPFLSIFGQCHAKRSLMSWVIFISKEGWVAEPI